MSRYPEEETARAALIRWAKNYYAPEIDDPAPDVEILSLQYDEAEDEWEAELDVSVSADHPFVTFWMGDNPLLENRIHVSQVAY